MKKDFKMIMNDFVTENDIKPGTVAIPVDLVVKRLQKENPDILVTKALVGRSLTKIFNKKQQYGTWGDISGLVQCYFMNKQIF